VCVEPGVGYGNKLRLLSYAVSVHRLEVVWKKKL
jgi:hypothetical protein